MRITPDEAARQATAQAAAWIAASPHLIDVLDWHKGLCGTCGPDRRCGEYHEIIAEYGAGENGTAVFWPEG